MEIFNSATATGGRHRGLCSGCRRPLPRGNGSWLDSSISRQTTSRAPQRPMASFAGSHAATARIAGLGPASSALHRPSVSPAASSAGAAAAAAHARAAHCRLGEDGTHHQRAIEETAAGTQRRPPLCRHSGPVGSIRHACAARARLAARLGVGLAGLRVGLDDMRRAGRRAGRGLGAGPGSRSLVSQGNHGEGGKREWSSCEVED